MKRRIGVFASILACAVMMMTTKSVSADPANEIVDGGVYEIASCINIDYVLDIDGGSAENRANLQLWPKNNSAAQRFQVRRVSGDLYTLTCLKSAKVIDAAMGSTENGTNLWQWVSNGSAAQLYRLISHGNGVFEMINAKSGLCMDASGGVAAKRTNVQLWRRNGSQAQRWYFHLRSSGDQAKARQSTAKRASISDGVYEIVSKVNRDFCLDISNSSDQNKANVQIWNRNKSTAQRFTIRVQDGVFYISNLNSKKYLDAANGGKESGTNVWQWQGNGSAAQQYRIYDMGDGTYEIQNVGNGLYLDVSGGIAKRGGNVQLWKGNHSAAQRWYLIKDVITGKSDEILEKTKAYVDKITTPWMSKEQKLRICFDSFRTKKEKNPWIPDYKGVDWVQRYADSFFNTMSGNCQSYAAAFGYMAWYIGYDNVYGCNTGHAWTEIDGLIYDPEWAIHAHDSTYFGIPYSARTSQAYLRPVHMDAPYMHVRISN